MTEKIYTVTQIGGYVKGIISAEDILHNILVCGEVTNFKISGRHGYFTLKDEEAQIFCTFFNIVSSVDEYPQNGDCIVVRGTADYYVKNGTFSMKVIRYVPYGVGDLHAEFLRLKEKLSKAGFFDESHKKPLPYQPKRIGVITSPTGAVIRDIINVTTRRNPYADIVLYSTKVQGEHCEVEVARAVRMMSNMEDIDVIIVGRGGGSAEDLHPFNAEMLVREIYRCQIPVISAVGHETDFTLCDFVADMRAPTPSAAAELASPDIMETSRNFINASKVLDMKITKKMETIHKNLEHTMDRLRYLSTNNAQKAENMITQKSQVMLNLMRKIYMNKSNELKVKITELEGLSPMKIVQRGFFKVLKDGEKFSSVNDVNASDRIVTHLLDGRVESVIDKIIPNSMEDKQ